MSRKQEEDLCAIFISERKTVQNKRAVLRFGAADALIVKKEGTLKFQQGEGEASTSSIFGQK